ncbi:carbohydrate-binding protein [Dyella japonica]|uniref:Carbohydrate-binding protein n=1 Tax=Dyella japonica A8 TaxID=1217721 RepID=A0A075K8W2_9GAMM|nr:carbohydrate-binding protein [Dyella japonica]AIF48633.1 carbohydrate-binding protein [Dyella japonica A8]
MRLKKSVVWLRTALNAIGTTAGGAMAMSLMTMAPVQTAHAQSTPACAAAWSSSTAYNGGAVVSENGINYVANWWTQGNDPATSNGVTGSGQPWTSQGACGGSSGSGSGSGTGGGTGTGGSSGSCAAAWVSSTAYNGGAVVSENGINYTANWWTQGNDPATNSGPSGSGKPWTSDGSCTGGSSSGGGTPPPPPPPPTGGGGPGTGANLLYSPYKDVTVNLNWNTNVMQTATATGSAIPVVGTGSLKSNYVTNLSALTLAFATGECGSENWGGVPGATFASANISGLSSASLPYVVGTGGAAGTFTCGSTAGFASFLSRYMSSQMVGVDFDIEGGQSQADINNLVAAAVYGQGLYPNLRFSFTLATLASSDGSYGGLNSLGDTVVKAIKASSLTNYTINLMVMDFGSPGATVCVVSNGKCDMGQSAIQAVANLQHTYGIPASKIELTPMIGVNDASDENFSIANTDTITSYAVSNGLAGLHFWSLDRDNPCSQTTASSTCNSVPSTTPLQYTKRFLSDLGR